MSVSFLMEKAMIYPIKPELWKENNYTKNAIYSNGNPTSLLVRVGLKIQFGSLSSDTALNLLILCVLEEKCRGI